MTTKNMQTSLLFFFLWTNCCLWKMTENLKSIVQSLNKLLHTDYNIISFDSVSEESLLQLLLDVFLKFGIITVKVRNFLHNGCAGFEYFVNYCFIVSGMWLKMILMRQIRQLWKVLLRFSTRMMILILLDCVGVLLGAIRKLFTRFSSGFSKMMNWSWSWLIWPSK